MLRHFLPHQMLQLVEERLFILKIPIYRRESHIGDLVEFAEILHQELSYIYSRYLPVRRIADLRFHPVDQFGKPRHAHRTLFARLQQTAQHLLAVELLATAILFDHHVRDFINSLVRSIPARAFHALAAAPDGIAFLAFTRIDYLIVQMIAKWTLHSDTSRPIRFRLRQSRPSFKATNRPSGTIATNVIAQRNTANAEASSKRTPNSSVSTRTETTCMPPPTPGIWTIDPNDSPDSRCGGWHAGG